MNKQKTQKYLFAQRAAEHFASQS